MHYTIDGLDRSPFKPLFALSDAALEAQGARRVTADGKPGFPCRVTLEDAEPGETLILLSHPHQTTPGSPYQAAGPVFVRESAAATSGRFVDEIPPYLANRLLSLRAYDADGMIVEADVVPGAEAEARITRFFARDDVAYLHAHFAARGCFAARIERG